MVTKSQHKITIRLTGLPSASPAEIFLSGNFNNWNPADKLYKLKKDDAGYFLHITNWKSGNYEFKFTGGSWNSVEVNADGSDISNHAVTVAGDSVFHFSIPGWKEDNVPQERRHSLSPNVSILDTAFYMPQLKRSRRIWIYLPAGYSGSKKYYPVLYMHDGQNLFDDATSYSGEWGVDEALDALRANCIVVGIDNSVTKRMNEYNVNTVAPYGKGEGKQYMEFIVKTLKPYIDKKFRSLPGRQSTFIAGSSMGGLISLYAGLYYPEVFGGVGIFSPAFSVAPNLAQQTEKLMKRKGRERQKYFFYTGGNESEFMVSQLLKQFQLVHRYNKGGMKAVIRSEGQHNESRWRLEFPGFYQWMIGTSD